jgi:hypothetical protein
MKQKILFVGLVLGLICGTFGMIQTFQYQAIIESQSKAVKNLEAILQAAAEGKITLVQPDIPAY